MSEPGQGIWYPSPDGWMVKGLRFANLLDDAKNVLSPVKFNLWAANLSGVSAVAAGLFAWIGQHYGMLAHVGDISSLVGPYLAGSHVVHHFDKRERNQQEVRLKGEP